jgi:serralysin
MASRTWKLLSSDIDADIETAAFWDGATAHDKSDRIIYDKATGSLFYDPNGSGQAAQIEFANLARRLKLDASEIYVT